MARRERIIGRIDRLPDGSIPPHVVVELGHALFGAYWQKSFSKEMHVNERTMLRWSNDGCPAERAPDLRKIIEARMNEITRMKDVLGEDD